MINGFIEFIRKQGVIGLAIGFMLGGALSKLTSALVSDVINPLIAMLINTGDLRLKSATIGKSAILWGDLVATTIDFIVIASVIYFGFKALRLDRMDLPKDDK